MTPFDVLGVLLIAFVGWWLIRYESREDRERRLSEKVEKFLARKAGRR